MNSLLKHSNAPINEAWYLREMAKKAYADVGHTKEGQIHSNRLYAIANMIETAVKQERELAERTEYAKTLLDALERARGCILGLLTRVPVRDADETLAEIDRVLGGVSDRNSAPTACEPVRMGDDGWSEWVTPLAPYYMQCCDCGLIHEVEFRIVKEKLYKPDGSWTVVQFTSDPTLEVIFRMRRPPQDAEPDRGSDG